MAKIIPLFSGSSGNSTYIATQTGAILVDAGASFKSIKEALSMLGEDITYVKAIAITHEHDDHIKGLKTILKNTGAKLITTNGTAQWLINNNKVPEKTQIIISDDNEILVGDTIVKGFSTSHDSCEPCGFTFQFNNGKKASICTDLGIVTDEVRNAISKSDLILLESNHDVEMLKKGPYPPHLKIRIMSDKGHISNNVCAFQLKNLVKEGTTRIILGHLSQKNNTPLIAKSCAESALMDLGAQNGKDYLLYVASPKENGVVVI